jgi:hypothetical protein
LPKICYFSTLWKFGYEYKLSNIFKSQIQIKMTLVAELDELSACDEEGGDEFCGDEEQDLRSLSWLQSGDLLRLAPKMPPTPPPSPLPMKPPSPPPLEIYRLQGDKKPPFSYAALIGMAMSSHSNKMTLSAIYAWIRENFLYYRNADPSWQVCFIIVCFIFYSY